MKSGNRKQGAGLQDIFNQKTSMISERPSSSPVEHVHDLPIRDGDGPAVLLQFLICHRSLLAEIALLRQPCKGRGAVLIFDGPCGLRTLLQQRRQYLLHRDAAFSQTAVEIPFPQVVVQMYVRR